MKTHKALNNNTALVVENSIRIKKLLIETISKLGYKAHGVSHGAKAIKYISREKNILVLLDYILPYITGQNKNLTLRIEIIS